ncbi:MAG TPA: hypothetical protein VLQ93_06885 [Myxococcaceae bacterium]|nr:hypothetical protein [Myxococcaceae bacterium]
MNITPPSSLRLPSFLHGPRATVSRKVRAEGRRCAKFYRAHGSFPHPHELQQLEPDDVVFTRNSVDFEPGRPSWRLYLLTELVMSLCEALDKKNHLQISERYEAFFRETTWGALYFITAELAPESAKRTALRIQAVLRSWSSLQHGRYLFKKLNTFLGLEELLTEACGWAMDAWSPEGGDSVRERLEVASTRMARATREDCVDAILGQLPRLLPLVDRQALSHPEIVTNLSAWREHLATLDDTKFERISGACPARVLDRLYLWDRELDVK